MAGATSIRVDEAARFGALASDWWEPRGRSRQLHRLNPVRLRYLREQLERHWGADAATRTPLAGKRVLDMGCGAGLLTEPLARLGGLVTGIDAAVETIAAACAHAEAMGLAVDYRQGDAGAAAGETFDLVVCFEVIEHVADPERFVADLAALLAPDGLLVLSTPNRTALSRLALIGIGETLGGIPRGTHDWDRLLTPDELRAAVERVGLGVLDQRGIGWRPDKGFVLTDDLRLNHLLTARR